MFRPIIRQIFSKTVDARGMRSKIFLKELQRQQKVYSEHLEKIVVVCKAYDKTVKMTMNKNLSTPYECAQSIQSSLSNDSVIALVNSNVHDLHRPLSEDCELKFKNFLGQKQYLCNLALWRSSAFLTNWILETSFDDDFNIELCSFSRPIIRSGSFVCDIKIRYKNSDDFDVKILNDIDLKWLNNRAVKLIHEGYVYQPLKVSEAVAMEIFSENPLKLKQIPFISSHVKHGDKSINMYKLGDHVDISNGPMISRTNQIGKFAITSLYPIETETYGRLFRIQGVSLPGQIKTLNDTFKVIKTAASKPNLMIPYPSLGVKSDKFIYHSF